MFPAVYARVKPVTTIANPACMKNTNAAAMSTHIVSIDENSCIFFLLQNKKAYILFRVLRLKRCTPLYMNKYPGPVQTGLSAFIL